MQPGTAFAVPEKKLDNAEILRRFPQGNMESFLKAIDKEKRCILFEGESGGDGAVKAAENLFSQTGVITNKAMVRDAIYFGL